MANEPLGTTPWRVGRKVGRTLYDKNDRLIGVVDTPDIASLIVDAVNGFWGNDVEPEVIAPTPTTTIIEPTPGPSHRPGGPPSPPPELATCAHPASYHTNGGCRAHVPVRELPGHWDYCGCNNVNGERCGPPSPPVSPPEPMPLFPDPTTVCGTCDGTGKWFGLGRAFLSVCERCGGIGRPASPGGSGGGAAT